MVDQLVTDPAEHWYGARALLHRARPLHKHAYHAIHVVACIHVVNNRDAQCHQIMAGQDLMEEYPRQTRPAPSQVA